MISATIFDFDGTLVDSMPLHYEAYRRAFAESGFHLSAEHFYRVSGGRAAETIPRLLNRETSLDLCNHLHARKKAILDELLEARMPRVLETAKLLPVLQQIGPLAIASSGSRRGIEKMINALGWRDLFSIVVTGDDVRHGKPAPDLFLMAAAGLERAPARCLVFEDSDDGIAAAMEAGMTVIDVRDMARKRPT